MPGLAFNGFIYPIKDGGKSIVPIKSAQRSSAQIPSTGVLDVAIAPVDTTKSIIIVSGTQRAGAAQPALTLVKGVFVNGTILRLARADTTNATVTDVYWQVIEFNNVKSLQTGNVTTTTGSTATTVTVSPVNLQKVMFVYSLVNANTNTTDGNAFDNGGGIKDASTLEFWSISNATQFWWQLIEFF